MSPRRLRRGWLVAAGLLALAAAALVAWAAARAAAVDVQSLATRAPRRTALMLRREAEARAAGRAPGTVQRWVPVERVAPLLRRAVLVAEDDAFFEHGGLDWREIGESARRNLRAGRIVRGGSTVTQQLARNLWLGTERTPWRKLEEVFLALRLERTLSKRRILELYLNLIEWGPGIYGAEAAARHWFGTSSAALGPREAVLLAAVIINPRRFSPLEPSRRIERRVRLIASRLRRRGALDDAGYRLAIGEPPLPVVPADSAALLPADSAAPLSPDGPPPLSEPESPTPLPDSGAAADSAVGPG